MLRAHPRDSHEPNMVRVLVGTSLDPPGVPMVVGLRSNLLAIVQVPFWFVKRSGERF